MTRQRADARRLRTFGPGLPCLAALAIAIAGAPAAAQPPRATPTPAAAQPPRATPTPAAAQPPRATPTPAAAQPARATPTATAPPAAAQTARATATAARTVSLNETGHLHLTSRHNFTLNEQGSASGSIAGAISVRLTAVSTSRVTVEVSIRPAGGSISGKGSGSYRRTGSVAGFSGTMSFGSGTGRFARAHGAGLSFSGKIEEANRDAITVYVRGTVSD